METVTQRHLHSRAFQASIAALRGARRFAVFSVIFEVQPRPGQRDAYLDRASALWSELKAVDGFIDNIRYRSQQRDGWILSLSDWRDEKALVCWRTAERHQVVQSLGRTEILVGQAPQFYPPARQGPPRNRP
jgi:heme-degrading monooxygenase HmoA